MTDGGPDQEQNGQDNVEARKEAATTALQSLAPYDRQEIMG
jgi:hypothetical protein